MKNFMRNIVYIGGKIQAIVNIPFNVTYDVEVVKNGKLVTRVIESSLVGEVDVYLQLTALPEDKETFIACVERAIDISVRRQPQLFAEGRRSIAKILAADDNFQYELRDKKIECGAEIGGLYFKKIELQQHEVTARRAGKRGVAVKRLSPAKEEDGKRF